MFADPPHVKCMPKHRRLLLQVLQKFALEGRSILPLIPRLPHVMLCHKCFEIILNIKPSMGTPFLAASTGNIHIAKAECCSSVTRFRINRFGFVL